MSKNNSRREQNNKNLNNQLQVNILNNKQSKDVENNAERMSTSFTNNQEYINKGQYFQPFIKNDQLSNINVLELQNLYEQINFQEQRIQQWVQQQQTTYQQQIFNQFQIQFNGSVPVRSSSLSYRVLIFLNILGFLCLLAWNIYLTTQSKDKIDEFTDDQKEIKDLIESQNELLCNLEIPNTGMKFSEMVQKIRNQEKFQLSSNLNISNLQINFDNQVSNITKIQQNIIDTNNNQIKLEKQDIADLKNRVNAIENKPLPSLQQIYFSKSFRTQDWNYYPSYAPNIYQKFPIQDIQIDVKTNTKLIMFASGFAYSTGCTQGISFFIDENPIGEKLNDTSSFKYGIGWSDGHSVYDSLNFMQTIEINNPGTYLLTLRVSQTNCWSNFSSNFQGFSISYIMITS